LAAAVFASQALICRRQRRKQPNVMRNPSKRLKNILTKFIYNDKNIKEAK